MAKKSTKESKERESPAFAKSEPKKESRSFEKSEASKPKGSSKTFIKGAIKKPGALHAQMGVPMGMKIPAGRLAAAAKAPGKLGQRARFARTLKKMSH
jgi:hypothetical protein